MWIFLRTTIPILQCLVFPIMNVGVFILYTQAPLTAIEHYALIKFAFSELFIGWLSFYIFRSQLNFLLCKVPTDSLVIFFLEDFLLFNYLLDINLFLVVCIANMYFFSDLGFTLGDTLCLINNFNKGRLTKPLNYFINVC